MTNHKSNNNERDVAICKPNNSENGKVGKHTCYTSNELFQLRDAWNMRHTQNPISADDPIEIWNILKQQMSTVCGSNEMCWLYSEFAQSSLQYLRNVFVPEKPHSWISNPTQWLTSTDISRVLKQYEDAYPDFIFIGPSPIDYDATPYTNSNACVWQDLCDFSLPRLISSGKQKVSVIFNLDTHDQTGSHWVSLYCDVRLRSIYYFDSNKNSQSNKIPDNIIKFINGIIVNMAEEPLSQTFKFYNNDKIQHQMKNTECGMYCLYFIISLLTGEKKWEDWVDNKQGKNGGRVSDIEMEKKRNELFNSPVVIGGLN
jgi:hypothetical protein|uniref:Ubiquitin-like protease family profile domain-containing protein n=1 Tax=viral metagenome TaxID=1070528 RepID=A0A6C0JG54_9ZZZZ